MSEEEKAIETLKEVASDNFDTLGDDISPKMAQNILNVISKQQKEIEELKKWHDVFLEMYIHKDKVGASYISKDKIREKIEKYEKWIKDSGGDYIESLEAQKYALNELLEEE